MRVQTWIVSAALLASAYAGTALAQDAQALTVELNELAPSAKGCKLTFVAGNGFAQSIDKVSFEFVLFDDKGLVERMAVLDFRDLPTGKTKVRQFDLPGTKCEAVKSMLINDAPVCEGEGVTKDQCMKALQPSSKSTVSLKG
ncbi:hypothetical protein [Pararhizobium sp.]|uniref:hypothetical protein n=1 Tax=Pararhizobium sp. TaxID=1977563 RepID=UPI002723AE69|nr:hypothetical protein [Pararhizobium sp.]MDO9414966.1 hypothetical protein [Pararhizobium sp.]